MKRTIIVRSLAAAGLAATLGLGGFTYYGPQSAHAVQTAIAASAIPLAGLPDFADLVEQTGPAVVNISVSQKALSPTAGRPGPNISPDDPMYEFFKRFQNQNPRGEEDESPAHGIGSGFIISRDGLILTNAHVVQNASEVVVKLTDRREFKAKVIGLDKQTDVAVLKIEAADLPFVKLGDSSKLRVGEWVVAIGSPFGFDNTVTSGIVSAKARSLPDGTYVPFIQTDVAVNPGNSGGPLFNLKGEVIGINSQIYSRSGGYQGLSFAIPIQTALQVKDQLVQHGKVTRGRLGVAIQDVNQSLANSFGLKKAGGALVSSVEPNSPAAKAGLQPGDVLLGIDGTEIASSIEVSGHVATLKPGSIAKLQVWREGKQREIAVSVGEAPSAALAAAAGKGDASEARLGVAGRELSAAEQQQAGVTGGVVVEQVAGPAARAGIRRGDIILSVNGKTVKSVEALKSAVKDPGTKALLVKRNDAQIFVPVELS